MTITSSDVFWEKKFRGMDPQTMDFSRSRPSASLVDFCNDHLAAGCRVLDLGCGGGRNAHYLAQEGFDLSGMEIS